MQSTRPQCLPNGTHHANLTPLYFYTGKIFSKQYCEISGYARLLSVVIAASHIQRNIPVYKTHAWLRYLWRSLWYTTHKSRIYQWGQISEVYSQRYMSQTTGRYWIVVHESTFQTEAYKRTELCVCKRVVFPVCCATIKHKHCVICLYCVWLDRLESLWYK